MYRLKYPLVLWVYQKRRATFGLDFLLIAVTGIVLIRTKGVVLASEEKRNIWRIFKNDFYSERVVHLKWKIENEAWCCFCCDYRGLSFSGYPPYAGHTSQRRLPVVQKNKRKQKNRFPLYSGAPPLLINCKWFTPACPTRMHVICIFVLSFCTDGILLYTFFASGFFSAFTGSADVSNVTVLCSLQVGSFCLHAFSVFAKVCKRSPAKCQKTSWNNRLWSLCTEQPLVTHWST